jgi:hypothetical protein
MKEGKKGGTSFLAASFRPVLTLAVLRQPVWLASGRGESLPASLINAGYSEDGLRLRKVRASLQRQSRAFGEKVCAEKGKVSYLSL